MRDEVVNDVVHHVIENSRRNPRHVAVKDADGMLTYEELIAVVSRAAAALTARDVAQGDRVVLLLQNSIDFVVGALASLWIGAIFVPLDATDPAQRLASLIADCRPSVVLSNGVADHDVLAEDLDTSIFMSMADLLVDAVDTMQATPAGERPSYLIYTSGTTGTPKGVTIGSTAFEVGVSSCCDELGLGPTTRSLLVSPLHFDGSFDTLFTTLVSGGTLIIRPRESLLFPRFFFNTVIAESVTYTGFTPSYLRNLMSDPQFHRLATSDLQVIALGGEACSIGDLHGIWSVLPQVRIFNRYGPTETTIAVTHAELTPSMLSSGVIPIGRPHPEVQFYLIDEFGRLIDELDIAGELYIGGRQLMDGYWNSPDLSAEVMVTDIVAGERVYRTGDIVYRSSADEYVYVGRADRVVKRSGIRISLVEITDAFSVISGVSNVATVVFDNDGVLGIATFLVVRSEVLQVDLYRQAREILPASMLPDHMLVVDAIPLLASGKTDDRALLVSAGLKPLVRTRA